MSVGDNLLTTFLDFIRCGGQLYLKKMVKEAP
ncbi:hypothetical protein ZONE111905_14480 [Zobellia nedashkovskayae]